MLNEHRYLVYYIAAIFVTILLYFSGFLEDFVLYLRTLGYLGSFFLGLFYTTAFTTPLSTVSYLLLDGGINPVIGGLLGGFGAMLTDLCIYKISESEVGKKFIIGKKTYKIKKIKNKFLLKISPFLAALIIAIPIPDELAAVLLGVEKYNMRRFALISFFANSLGIFLLLYLGLSV